MKRGQMKLGVHIGYWGMGLTSEDQLGIVQDRAEIHAHPPSLRPVAERTVGPDVHFLDVADRRLCFAASLLDLALLFQLLIAYELAGDFLDHAAHFLDLALDLVFVAHDWLLVTCTDNRSVRHIYSIRDSLSSVCAVTYTPRACI